MALIGKDFAIASVGISCQPASQIVLNGAQIALFAGDSLQERTTPFDGLLVGASNAARMIEDRCFFPTDFDGPLLDSKPFWPRYGVHFWHAKTSNPADFVSKFSHIVENWDAMRDCRRMVFVVANTQNNISRVLADRQHIETRLTFDDVFRLWFALTGYFVGEVGRRSIELHAVTATGLDGGVRVHPLLIGGRPAIRIHKIGRDDSQWSGDDRAWRTLLETIVR